jgi:flagellin
MGMVVRTNMAALGANNSLAQASKAQQNGMQKLYTGFKINAAKDDASGLAISEKMKNQIKALDTAKDNCEDGANMIQTAEGYMKETHDILTRMTELSEKAANGLLKDEDRNALQNEMDQLCGEIDRMASTANFNGVKLLDGSLGSKGVVHLESKVGEEAKYVKPDAESNRVGAGIALKNDDLTDGAEYAFKEETAGTDFTKCEVTFSLQKTDGTASDDEVTVNVAAIKGDTITLDADGNGTSQNGLVFSGVDSKSGTFTFDGTDWKNANGDALVAGSGTMASGLVAGDKFTYDKANAIENPVDVSDPNNGIKLQIGESSTSADRLNVSINSFHTDSLLAGIKGFVNRSNDATDAASTSEADTRANTDTSTYKNAISVDISDKDKASAAADGIRQIAGYVSDVRGQLGAQQNRLDHTVNNLTTASENTTAAKSRILDTDMAKEMMEYTSKNVIAQAAQSMLAQANSQPQNVLSLLQ